MLTLTLATSPLISIFYIHGAVEGVVEWSAETELSIKIRRTRTRLRAAGIQ